MKKLIKVVLVLLALALLIGSIVFGIFLYKGYDMYKTALSESSMQERVEKIRSKSDYLGIDLISNDFKDAIIAIEDHRFETHGAVDFISIGRAIFRNVTSGSFDEGGSTITQQLAKNTFFTQEQKFTRKIAEIFAAIDMEKTYSKDQILELYMNTIYFGDGYYGINAASHGYFDKAPLDLTFDEATLLAGIPNAPSIYSLSNNPNLARQRQKYVIQSMIEYGFIKDKVLEWAYGSLQYFTFSPLY